MICDPDPELGMATQLSGIIKLLVDPENMLASSVVNVSLN
jgi:protein phosphatase-4 regulatory subunit 3